MRTLISLSQIIVLCTASLFLTSCGPQTMYVHVEVLDKFSVKPIDSAEVVIFRQALGGSDMEVYRCLTDGNGVCALSFEIDEQFAYRVEATRQHFVNPVSEDGSDYLHQAALEISDSNSVILYLESILPPDPGRFEKMHSIVPISQVVAAISADEWAWTFLPKISWTDVPILLNQGQDSTFIKKYPRNPRSRYRPDSIRAGLASLWLIEALRKQQLGNQKEFYSLNPPSRAPVLGTRRGNPSGYNSVEQINLAHEAYAKWWSEMPADSTERAKAIRENPLKGIGISWM